MSKLGNNKSIEESLNIIKDKIFNMSCYMLSDLHDAEDTTQEILIKVISNFKSLKTPDRFKS